MCRQPNERVYPVPVKPASDIQHWGQWPDDVRQTLRDWNKSRVRRLRFTHVGVFKCQACQQFCKSHTYGAAVLDGDPYCDDCLIDVARGWVFLGKSA